MEPKEISIGLYSHILDLRSNKVLIYADIPEINPCDTCIITVVCSKVCEQAALFSWGSLDAEHEVFTLGGRTKIFNGGRRRS